MEEPTKGGTDGPTMRGVESHSTQLKMTSYVKPLFKLSFDMSQDKRDNKIKKEGRKEERKKGRKEERKRGR